MGILSLDRHVDAAVLDGRGSVAVTSGGNLIQGVLRDVPHLFVEGAQLSVTLQIGADRFEAVCRVLDDAVACAPGSHVALEVLRAAPAGISGIEPFDLVPLTPAAGPVAWVTPPFGMSSLPPQAAFAEEEAPEDDEPTGVIGTLREMPVSEIVQTLASGRRDAIVEIKPKGEAGGTLAIEKGRVVFAQKGPLFAEEAFYALFVAARGAFRIRYGRHVETRNIDRETTYLLLEAARVWDEVMSGRNVRPSVQAADEQVFEIADIGAVPDPVPELSLVPPPLPSSFADAAPTEVTPAPASSDAGWRVPSSSSGLFSRFFDEAGVDAPAQMPTETQRFQSLHVPGLTDLDDQDAIDSQATTREKRKPDFSSQP